MFFGPRCAGGGRASLGVVLLVALAGCRDLSRFSTGDDHYEGPIVQGAFVRAGFDPSTNVCLTLDANRLEDAPGALSTTDGRFTRTPLRPVPQVWHDPLATLNFGEGRIKNVIAYLHAAPANGASAPSGGADVMAIVSLMQTGDVEVRLLRGAPAVSTDDAGATAEGDAAAPSPAPPTPDGENLFGIFPLTRAEGPCSY